MSVVAYPDDSLIEAETGRNKEAALYVMERAACPLGVLGLAVRIARCGAFDDDLEVNSGWTVNPDGTDTAPASGRFVRANPASTSSNGPKQLGTTTSGSEGFVTGAPAGSSSTAYDLDGRTSIRSPAIELPATAGQHLTFRYVFAHSAASTTSDGLRAFVERSDGTRVQVFRVVGAPVDVDGTWRSASLSLDAFAGQTDPPPVRGGRRWTGQPGRGRARRHPGDATGLMDVRPWTSDSFLDRHAPRSNDVTAARIPGAGVRVLAVTVSSRTGL